MEGDAGASQLPSQLNPADAPDAPGDTPTSDATPEESTTTSPSPSVDGVDDDEGDDGDAPVRRAERFGRIGLASICVLLLLLAGGVALAGYRTLRANEEGAAIARDEAMAVAAARDCVTATQAPNFDIMSASQAKMIDCTTGDFGTQATLYSSILADAYQAAKVKLEVTDMRAAAERHNDDGTINVLVALRVKVTNTQAADQEQGYRLRVQMVPEDGTFKVAKLEQVTS